MLQTETSTDYEKINTYLLKTTCLLWILAKLIGWRMFTNDRLFPTVPLFDYFENVPGEIHVVLYWLSLLFLLVLFEVKKNRAILCCLLFVELFLCLLDQNRWQPWEYQYLFILFIFIVNPNDPKLVTAAFAFILACTYFYSGLSKLNEGFLQTIWTKMMLEMFLKIPAPFARQYWLHYTGYFIGLVELIAGIGLLFVKTQKKAAIVLIFMHLFILVFLGPFGLKYNRIVWPWNIAMILFLYLIFLRKKVIIAPFKSVAVGWNKLVFICWGILPALNFAGIWDNYLSSGIYSGKLPRMLICIKDTSKCRALEKYCRKDNLNLCSGGQVIDIQYWAMSETNVAPYPEIRVYKKIESKVQEKYPAAGLSYFYFLNGKWQSAKDQTMNYDP